MASMVLPCSMGKVVGNDYNPEGQEGQEKRGEWVPVVEVGSIWSWFIIHQ